jgi:hypothetical protein
MPLPAALLAAGRPGNANLAIVQGDTWYQAFTITSGGVAVDLTGLTATLQVRTTYGGTVLATASCTIPTPTDGTVIAQLTAATTAALTVVGDTLERALGVYDLNLTDGTQVSTPITGRVTLVMEVTKP